MSDLVFVPVVDKIEDSTYVFYDGACGTGGMLTVAKEKLSALAYKHGKSVLVHLCTRLKSAGQTQCQEFYPALRIFYAVFESVRAVSPERIVASVNVAD